MHFSIDIPSLLSPISKENPTGNDLRLINNDFFNDLKEKRNNAKEIERKNLQTILSPPQNNWKIVHDLSIKILKEDSKDIEVSCWLTEALLRLEGFSGLEKGFSLIKNLILHFQDKLHPLPDEEGFINTFYSFLYLNGIETDGVLVTPIALIPLTEEATFGPFALWQYQQAIEFAQINSDDYYKNLGEKELLKIDDIITAAKETNPFFFDSLLKNIRSCLLEYEESCSLIEKTLTEKTVPSSRIKNQLQLCLNCAETLSKYSEPKQKKLNQENEITSEENIKKEIVEIEKSTTITRQKALENIKSASHYFKQSEPHSPLPYLLEKALRWGKMEFHELIHEFILDETTKNHIYHLIDINHKT